MDKSFSLEINVINGEVLEFSQLKYFRCDLAVPIGETIIRYFNDDMCSVDAFRSRCWVCFRFIPTHLFASPPQPHHNDFYDFFHKWTTPVCFNTPKQKKVHRRRRQKVRSISLRASDYNRRCRVKK